MVFVEHQGQRYQMGEELSSTMTGFYDLIEAGVIHQGSVGPTYVNSVIRGPGKYYRAIPVSDKVLFEPGTVVYSDKHNCRGRVLAVTSYGTHLVLLSNGALDTLGEADLQKQGGLRDSGRAGRWGWYKDVDGVDHFLSVPGGMPGFTFQELLLTEFEWVCEFDPSF